MFGGISFLKSTQTGVFDVRSGFKKRSSENTTCDNKLSVTIAINVSENKQKNEWINTSNVGFKSL